VPAIKHARRQNEAGHPVLLEFITSQEIEFSNQAPLASEARCGMGEAGNRLECRDLAVFQEEKDALLRKR
jgi:hypothetical protein